MIFHSFVADLQFFGNFYNTLDPKHKKMIAFQKRITKYRDHVFTFLYHPTVPPDNNDSERAIRNVKVKQKTSGQLKILSAAENFANRDPLLTLL